MDPQRKKPQPKFKLKQKKKTKKDKNVPRVLQSLWTIGFQNWQSTKDGVIHLKHTRNAFHGFDPRCCLRSIVRLVGIRMQVSKLFQNSNHLLRHLHPWFNRKTKGKWKTSWYRVIYSLRLESSRASSSSSSWNWTAKWESYNKYVYLY